MRDVTRRRPTSVKKKEADEDVGKCSVGLVAKNKKKGSLLRF